MNSAFDILPAMITAAEFSARNRRAEASEERRARVLKAANACFCRNGFRKTAVEHIAREAGVSKGLVFAFFSDKETLFREVLGCTLTEWRRFSEQEAARCADDPPSELRQLFVGSFDFIQRFPMLWPMLRHSDRDWMDQWPEVQRVNDEWQRRLARVLRRGIAGGQFRADLPVRRTADVIHELQRGLLTRQLNGESVTALADIAAELLLNGLRP